MAQKKKPRGRPPKKETAQLISFRLTPDLIEQLKRLCDGERDETGAALSYTAYARRLLIQALAKSR